MWSVVCHTLYHNFNHFIHCPIGVSPYLPQLKSHHLLPQVHARDVIDKLVKTNASSTNDFEWVSQLRFYWDKELNDCVVKQVLSVFMYGYEYQGNNGRLVITPLTDRCSLSAGRAHMSIFAYASKEGGTAEMLLYFLDGGGTVKASGYYSYGYLYQVSIRLRLVSVWVQGWIKCAMADGGAVQAMGRA